MSLEINYEMVFLIKNLWTFFKNPWNWILWDIISHNVPGQLREIISQRIFKLQENTQDINSLKME